MRLINLDTMKMEEFHGSDIPAYYILSHTWDSQGEISFQEYLWLSDHDEAKAQGVLSEMTPKQRERAEAKANFIRSKSGFSKIDRFAALVRDLARRNLNQTPIEDWSSRSESVHHIWIDTVCINKESSAELSEAINSMFAWYQRAVACCAYMGDCESDADLAEARWFTRGWTLQELLAPKEVIFFSASWMEMGTRQSLARTISAITKIQPEYLLRHGSFSTASIARRMSWASNRRTTREEDTAYCLLGIFNINMPLLYGEGSRAFIRLQEEIIKHDNDHTIFCWSWPAFQSPIASSHWGGFFAPQPSVFAESGHFRKRRERLRDFQLTNAGLRIEVMVLDCLRETYKLIVFDATEPRPHRDHLRLVCVLARTTSRGALHLVRPPLFHRLLIIPYSWRVFKTAGARRTVYLLHERDPDLDLMNGVEPLPTLKLVGRASLGLPCVQEQLDEGHSPLTSVRHIQEHDRRLLGPLIPAVMPILSPDLSNHLWGETRRHRPYAFGVTDEPAFAFTGKDHSLTPDSVFNHTERHFSMRVENVTSMADWDVKVVFNDWRVKDKVASLSAIAGQDTEFLVTGSDSRLMKVRLLFLNPSPEALPEFPRWIPSKSRQAATS